MNTSVAQAMNTFAKESNRQGLLSFGSGVENQIGVRAVIDNYRYKIENQTGDDHNIIFIPSMALGIPVALAQGSAGDPVLSRVLAAYGVPEGIPVQAGEYNDKAGKKVTITCENPGQSLQLIASEQSNVPTQITSLSMKSFSETGIPDNTNYGNSITAFKLSSLEEIKRGKRLNLDAFQNSKDVSTEMLKIDLIENNFEGLITQNDCFIIKINKNTKLFVNAQIGARLNPTEYFYRQVKAGNKALRSAFPHEAICNG